MAADPDYGLRMSWNFLARSTSGLLDWAERLGPGVDAGPAHRSRTFGLDGCCRRTCCARPAPRKPPPSAASATSSTSSTWCWRRPLRCRRRRCTHFDKRGGLSTDRAMIRACPVTWPWNLLGWPSINVPAGFTSEGLPIGVQLMGPANSEPLLISLAAELEAVNGWVTQAARRLVGPR